MKLRILYVSHSFPLPRDPLSNVGGMQRVAVDLHDALGRNPSIELTSLLLETSSRWTELRTAPFLFRALGAIPRIVREKEIEVVLFSSMVTATVTIPLRRVLHTAGTVTAAIPVGRDVTLPISIYQRIVPRVFNALDHVFPISRATAAACLDRGADPDRVRVVPCGVTFPLQQSELSREIRRRAVFELLRSRGHHLHDDALLLLSVGRHQERKGFHWFVNEVMPNTTEDTVYLLAGDGPMTGKIEAAVQRHRLSGRVILLGRIDEHLLQMLYAGTDLFVMPNIAIPGDIEGFGVVMLEANAAGLPVLAAELEGIRDVVVEGENGHLVPSENAASFLSVINRYRQRNLPGELRNRAASHVRENFGWDGIVQQYLDVLTRPQ